MKYSPLLLVLFALILGCSGEKSDEYMLEQDRKEFAERVLSPKVLLYKYFKISIRASALKDTSTAELRTLKKVSDMIDEVLDTNKTMEMNPLDYYTLFVDYVRIRSYIQETDEDIFPTLSEAMDSDSLPDDYVFLAGEEKAMEQNMEHAILGLFALILKDFGPEIALYECSKTNPELFPESEPRALFQYLRAVLFMASGYHYMAEKELSDNIRWLDANPNVELPLTRFYFAWVLVRGGEGHPGRAFETTDEQHYLMFHSLNLFLRGMDRLMMERDIDEERALVDFQACLDDLNKLGVNNELSWSIDAYLALEAEDSDRAIRALTNLKTSPVLSESEVEALDEAIAYLEKREPDKVLNGVYDKYFMNKIMMKYIYSRLREVNWQEVLEKNGVKNTEKAFETIETVKQFMENMEQYTKTENLKEKGKELKEEGGKLLDKAKDLLGD